MDNKLHFSISIDKNINSPIYIQLYEYIKHEIVSNHFKANYKLPSIREAASILNISKTTIENAYNQLILEGYIENISKKGFFINEISDYKYNKEFNNSSTYINSNSSNTSYENSGVDENSFDTNLWKKLYNKVLTSKTTNIYKSGAAQGECELRNEISQFVNNIRGGNTTPEQIIIGAGIQYLIGILTAILMSKEKLISFETPGYKKAEYVFEDYLFKINHVIINDNPICVQNLIDSKSKMLYVSPSHQYPLGNVMPIKKRYELLNWAYKTDSLIIEDDYDGLIRYDGMPIPCLQGLDSNDCVIYLGSFSKMLLPSLRISYMIIPKKYIKSYEAIKDKYTQSTSKIDQIVLSSFMSEGYMTKHLRKIRRIYKHKNTMITSYIESNYKNTLKIINSDSGFHIVLEAITDTNINNIINNCKKNNILIEIIDSSPNKILFSLNYSGINTSNINSFIDKFMKAIN